jgi:hypothetical protein
MFQRFSGLIALIAGISVGIKGISEQADKVNKLGDSQRERDRILTRQNQASISS